MKSKHSSIALQAIRLGKKVTSWQEGHVFYAESHVHFPWLCCFLQASLESINEEGTLVTHIEQLLLAISGSDSILSFGFEQFTALPVLFLEQLAENECHDDSGAADAETSAEACWVLRSLISNEDVRARDTAQVAH